MTSQLARQLFFALQGRKVNAAVHGPDAFAAWDDEVRYIAGLIIAGDYRDLFEEMLESL